MPDLGERLQFGQDLRRRLNEGDDYDSLYELAKQLERFPSHESQAVARDCRELLSRRLARERVLLIVGTVATTGCIALVILVIQQTDHCFPTTIGLLCGSTGILLLLIAHAALLVRNAVFGRASAQKLAALIAQIGPAAP